MTWIDPTLPVRSLSIGEVQHVFALLVEKQWSLAQASDWATERWQLADQRDLAYVPPQAEKPLWDALLFLQGIDMQVSPTEYLYTTEDVLVYSNQFEQRVKQLV